ncbi:non-canonical purine NTP pyrophosphatase [Gemmatimonas sp.]|uniref:non-canonical purine NTP pyrophosphatase n=1 Tax=Gemmatimonas sp. TaxID=1962908 RepID=UPI0037C0A43C
MSTAPRPPAGASDVPARGELVLATRSAGKLRELGPLVAQHGWRAVTLDMVGVPEVPEEALLEVHDSFEANALAKARWFAAKTGRPVVADDSGLVVAALNGRPGVFSKRWSGSALEGAALDAFNNQFLLERLQEAAAHGRTERTAQYVCAAACVWPEGELVVHGTTSGTLLVAPRGSGGFGYDPYFLSDDLGATFAEVDGAAKARVSHRGRAFGALLTALDARMRACVDPRFFTTGS